MACKNCNPPILNQDVSIIGNTKCNGNCPEDAPCVDYLGSNCVYYSGDTLTCLSDPTAQGRTVQNGDSLTTILNTLNNSYGVRVDSSDTCCGFLADKIISSNPSLLRVSVQTLSGCQTLVLTPSGSTGTQTCVGKVQTNSGDSCGYLVNKVSSTDGSITITDNSGTTGKLDLSVGCQLNGFVNEDDTTCDYLINKFTDGAVYPTVDVSSGEPKIRFDFQTVTFASRAGALPISVDQTSVVAGQQMLCSGYSASTFPKPENTGIPIAGGGRTNSSIWISDPVSSPIVTLSQATFSNGLRDQGLTGTFDCKFDLVEGIFNVSIQYNITNNNTRLGNTGFLNFFLQDVANPTSQVPLGKLPIVCSAEYSAYGAGVVNGVVIPSGGKSYLLRVQNSVAAFAGSTNDNILLSFQKVG